MPPERTGVPLRNVAPRNARIDLLRGASILLVVLDHLAQRIPIGRSVLGSMLPARVFDGLISHGYEAVFIFFVISGFLITSNSLDRWHYLNQIDLRTFYARRFARIVPCLVVLVALLSCLHWLGVKEFVITHENQSLPGAVTAALGFYLNWYEGYTGHYLPGAWDVLWSLSIEEVFYVGFPIVCLVLRREWLLTLFLVLLALSFPWSRAAAFAVNEIWHEKAYLPGMAAIATGILTALAAARFRLHQPFWINLLTIAGSLGVGAVLFADGVLWRAFHEGILLVLALSAACLLLAFHSGAVRKGSESVLPGTSWLRAFGRLSYETYLTHMFVVFAAAQLFRITGANEHVGFLWYLPAVALSGALAQLIDTFLSTPCNLALRNRLARPRRPPVLGAEQS
ncbi:MAG: acyltransferase [Pseudomonadota bacterium]|nr:acyltransferase [Pseudomonadota bacterium]